MTRSGPDTPLSSRLGLALQAGLIGILSLALMLWLDTLAAQVVAVSAVALGAAEAIYRSRSHRQDTLAKAYVPVRSSRRR